MNRAILVGSAGQDGCLLRERLERDGVQVTGLDRAHRRGPDGNDEPPVDILDGTAVRALVASLRPRQVYYLAAHHASAEERGAGAEAERFEASHRVHVVGLLHFLDALRAEAPDASLFYAASSLVFGDPGTPLQDEATPLAPLAAYGITKACGMLCCRLYRREHGLRASVGILYNHESPSRLPGFVSRKIVDAAVAIRRGSAARLVLADLSARVDWGYAPDFVDAMVRILALEEPGDFVVATGEARSVGEFVEVAFGLAGLDWRRHVIEDRSLVARPSPTLVGDARRLRAATGWAPTVRFEEMVGILFRAALARAGEAG